MTMTVQGPSKQLTLFPENSPARPIAMPLDPRFPSLTAESTLELAIHWFESWLTFKGRSDNTRESYLKAVSLFARYVGARRVLVSITSEDVQRFFAYDAGKGKAQHRASKTIELHGTAVRAFFAALQEADILKHNLAQKAFPAKGKSPVPEFLFPSQADKLRQTAARMATDAQEPRPRPYLLVLLMLDLGLRLMEVEALDLSDIDTSNSMRPIVYVRPAERRHEAKRRAMNAPADLVPAMQLYTRAFEINEGRLFPVDRRTLQLEVESVGQAAELPVRLSPELLRWTYALAQFRAGVPEDRLRQQLGLSKLGWDDAKHKLEQMARPAV